MAVQSAVTLIFVFCTIIIFEQTYFMVATDPGFEPANLVRLNTSGLKENEIDRLQQSISAHPLVSSSFADETASRMVKLNPNERQQWQTH